MEINPVLLLVLLKQVAGQAYAQGLHDGATANAATLSEIPAPRPIVLETLPETTTLDELIAGTALRNKLKRAGMRTLGDVLDKGNDYLTDLPNFGSGYLDILDGILAQAGHRRNRIIYVDHLGLSDALAARIQKAGHRSALLLLKQLREGRNLSLQHDEVADVLDAMLRRGLIDTEERQLLIGWIFPEECLAGGLIADEEA